MRNGVRGVVMSLVVGVLLTTSDVASADPLPGFELDPVQMTARMEGCLSYRSARDDLLMGWVKVSTGEQRRWRCSSLRHMMRHDGSQGSPHDPFVNVADFMRCVDRIVSYGFPRRLARHPGNISLIKQYNGTLDTAIVAVNEATGDIATVYTDPRIDDWTGCAHAL